ncbi:Uncharacterised protein [Mycobacteroides abscessus subsp. abscessus]|nr:Uncharacterised protein [Mycobacteroides abscessus subsp. abscessus]
MLLHDILDLLSYQARRSHKGIYPLDGSSLRQPPTHIEGGARRTRDSNALDAINLVVHQRVPMDPQARGSLMVTVDQVDYYPGFDPFGAMHCRSRRPGDHTTSPGP